MSDDIDDESTLADAIEPASLKGQTHLSLLVLSGPAAGQWHAIPPDGGVIGRHPEADIRLSDPAISRRHAEVEMGVGGKVWLRDLGSRNGLYVDGKKVSETQVVDGDQVQLSTETLLRVRLLGAMETLMLHDLQQAATTDALTGAYNRRYLMRRMLQELSFSKRHAIPLSVLMVDIDGFKAINDQHGHGAGDAVLQGVTQAMEDTAREEDVVVRFGGDEFVILVRGYGADSAVRFGQRICDAVYHSDVHSGPQQVTVSVGVADYQPGDTQRDASLDSMGLLMRADAAVYRAKEAGRNRVELWTGTIPPDFAGDLRKTMSAPAVRLVED